MTAMHKGILVGLIVGALAVYYWQNRAGRQGG